MLVSARNEVFELFRAKDGREIEPVWPQRASRGANEFRRSRRTKQCSVMFSSGSDLCACKSSVVVSQSHPRYSWG